ncbi:MAG: hypothetical protein IH840_08385 [Candidatus Heimdallarchaeota archaeon]|nr:hypothetical protein [Candidatus Heimdallarchaeota archaeon]
MTTQSNIVIKLVFKAFRFNSRPIKRGINIIKALNPGMITAGESSVTVLLFVLSSSLDEFEESGLEYVDSAEFDTGS